MHKNTKIMNVYGRPLSLFFILLSMFVFSRQATESLQFESKFVQLGTVEAGTKIPAEFPFVNVSNEPVVILEVKPNCGCTVSKFPKRPIKPGEKGVIKLIYDTHHQSGYNQKFATVKTSHSKEDIILTMRVHVRVGK
jgi:hypothetical protein